MRKHFESGLAFIVVAVISVTAGLMLLSKDNNGSGIAFLLAGGLWVIVAIGVRNKTKHTQKNNDADSGSAN
jgi:hypothetical protein